MTAFYANPPPCSRSGVRSIAATTVPAYPPARAYFSAISETQSLRSDSLKTTHKSKNLRSDSFSTIFYMQSLRSNSFKTTY